MELSSNVFEYQSFLAEQMIEQAKMERYIKECILIGESKNTAKNVDVLTESVTDKIKEAFKKIMEFIGKMWGKFLEAMNNLISGNRAYLEKYKDIILKKKLNPNTTYTMFNYEQGLKNMMTTAVPILNYGTMQADLADADAFELKHFRLIPKSDSSFADRCKAYFRGGSDPTPIPSAKINMTDVFNYCYNYESKMKPLLEKDLKEIKTAANNVAAIIDKAEKERNAAAVAAPEATNTSSGTQESYNMYGEKQYYSYVYESYITELEINNTGATNNGGTENNPAANMKNTQGEPVKGEDQAKAVKADATSYDDQIKKMQTYLNVCGGLLGSKATIAEEMFKEYMQIVKAHVRDNVGASKKNTSNDKVADAGTNYKNMVDNAFKKQETPKSEKEKAK